MCVCVSFNQPTCALSNRQQNMEMAATALVAAALKDKEEEEGKGQSSDISGSDGE